MIAAISVMRERDDVTLAKFRRHWLDPHGVMTAELPGVRYYIQSHCLDAPGTNALARDLAPFRRLAPRAEAVMVGHAVYPGWDGSGLPGTLSPAIATRNV